MYFLKDNFRYEFHFLQVLGVNGTYHSFSSKLFYILEALDKLNLSEDTLVLFSDAYDVLAQGV